MKTCISLLIIFLYSVYALSIPPKVIVIDPGHGGKDPGTSYKGVQEKDITLAVSLLLRDKLVAKLPDTKLVLTRETDVYNNVVEKAEIANKAKGELFVSIHVNSADSKKRTYRYIKKTYYAKEGGKKVKKTKKVKQYYTISSSNQEAKGTEIYIWASDRADNKSEAISSSYSDEDTHASEDEVPDLNSPEAKLISQMYAQRFFKNSFKLANYVDEEFKKIERTTRGIKQRNDKGIWVLQATAMPAILIELGYVTNQEESDYLSSPDGQEELAEAIANSIVRYVQ